MTNKPIGILQRIRRFPVKSMGGEDLESVYVHETGLNGDRIYAFYDNNSIRSNLPYLTGREKKSMLLMQPEIADEPNRNTPYPEGYRPSVFVTIPGHTTKYEVSDRRVTDHIRTLIPDRKIDITLDYRKAGIFDSKPVSIMGLGTVKKLADETGLELDPRRFRENFYIDWENDQPFFEDSLVGKSLRIGVELLLHVVKENKRCMMICIDPNTAEYDKRVLGSLAKRHETNAGVYAMVRQPGVVRKGDPVILS